LHHAKKNLILKPTKKIRRALPTARKITRNNSFIKLAKKISLDQWNDAGAKLADVFIQLIHILKD